MRDELNLLFVRTGQLLNAPQCTALRWRKDAISGEVTWRCLFLGSLHSFSSSISATYTFLFSSPSVSTRTRNDKT